MTLKELSQLYYLKREIETDTHRLKELEALVSSPSGPNITGMPGGGRRENRMERYVAEIVELKELISEKRIRCIQEQKRIEKYIADIPDSLTRQIFTLRFIKRFSWDACAAHIGGENTWKNLSNICYRYIRKTNSE